MSGINFIVNSTARQIIENFNLIEHPEGGYFKEMYRSDIKIIIDVQSFYQNKSIFFNLDRVDKEIRSVYTVIYYLLTNDQYSAIHKIKHDEIWHFYKGSPVTIFIINDSDSIIKIKLGSNIDCGEYLNYRINGDTWFGVELNDKSSYALMGCTVSPGFDFKDFELGKREELLQKYPQHKDIIMRLTKPSSVNGFLQ